MTVALRLPGFEDYPPDTPRRRQRPPTLRPPTTASTGAEEQNVATENPNVAAETMAVEADRSGPATTVERAPFTIEVVKSARRKRTVGAQLVGSVLKITTPTWMTQAQTAPFIRDFEAKFRRKMRSDSVELPQRAATLATRYALRLPQEIRWVDDMNSRWASCTSSTGAIRVSSRLANFPAWVLDYVIIHELAHLTEANHSPRFWELVNAYPLTERATGYLIAKSGPTEDEF